MCPDFSSFPVSVPLTVLPRSVALLGKPAVAPGGNTGRKAIKAATSLIPPNAATSPIPGRIPLRCSRASALRETGVDRLASARRTAGQASSGTRQSHSLSAYLFNSLFCMRART